MSTGDATPTDVVDVVELFDGAARHVVEHRNHAVAGQGHGDRAPAITRDRPGNQTILDRRRAAVIGDEASDQTPSNLSPRPSRQITPGGAISEEFLSASGVG